MAVSFLSNGQDEGVRLEIPITEISEVSWEPEENSRKATLRFSANPHREISYGLFKFKRSQTAVPINPADVIVPHLFRDILKIREFQFWPKEEGPARMWLELLLEEREYLCEYICRSTKSGSYRPVHCKGFDDEDRPRLPMTRRERSLLPSGDKK